MIGMVYSRMRIEEKFLLEAFRKAKIDLIQIDPRELMLNGGNKPQVNLVFNREIGQVRSELILKYFETCGLRTINSSKATRLCNNKAISTWVLQKNKIPMPKTYTVFSLEQAFHAAELLTYPVVVKPIMGSWGRLIAKVDNKDSLQTIIEHKEALGNPYQQVFYLQKYRDKPERDIRVLTVGKEPIAAMYRKSDHWITNTALGGVAKKCEIDASLEKLVLKILEIFSIDIAGIDFIETENGYEVLEINSTPEFHGLQTTTEKNIADYMVSFISKQA
ncbi:MAG TPA: lysine biosynthesis protein LysX [Candidatus Acidoferrales bacterium]|nr:lysine biosynthesis protein LysX [Candidatus Acidoferrales bacterium]